jgi:hypothetical protein
MVQMDRQALHVDNSNIGAARRAFCSLLSAHTSSPAADLCRKRHACKYNTHMVLDGGEDGHTELPVPAYVHAFAPLAHKRALARLRLSKRRSFRPTCS